MKRSNAVRVLAGFLACVCVIGLLSGCGLKSRREELEEYRKNAEESRKHESKEQEPSSEDPVKETNPPDDPNDPIVPGKWVLTNSRFTQIASDSTDADGDYTNTYTCSLYEHTSTHSYDPEEPIDDEDKPWAVRYVCTCMLSKTELRPGEEFSVAIEATADYYEKQIFGMCCRLYFDESWMKEAAISARGYDYSGVTLYPVHVGASCGPGYGHALDEPWSIGDYDVLTVTMPTVRQSTLKKYAAFTVQFATDVGDSYYEFTWVSD
ncbi:MAG: hypothetical protein II581_01330 [Oscillospiraceae bacterium]|nr:hypothetical protein [Oscillospiraceae bacterium]